MSTAWITIASTDLDDYDVAAEIDAAQTAALASGQADPFDTVMPDVIARMRAQIASCDNNVVSATANSIPPSLKTHACWLIIEAMVGRLSLTLSDERKTMVADAKRYMEKVASCDYVIEDPTDPVDPGVSSGGDIVIVTSETRRATRATLAGL